MPIKYAMTNMRLRKPASAFIFSTCFFSLPTLAVTTANPKLTPAAGSHHEALSVSIIDATKGAVIYYTTDGTVPTADSRKYTVPFKIDKSTIVKAIASAPDDTSSAVVTADYAILPRVTATILYSFGVSATDGRYPFAGVIQGSDGNFYGTTAYGGKFDAGTVFRVTPDGTETILHNFGYGTDAALPQAGLIEGADGTFYGTTQLGGAHNAGTVFQISRSGKESVLYSFGAYPSDGEEPYAAVTLGNDGNLYGTTVYGGAAASSVGTVFKVTLTGTETVLHSFAVIQGDGIEPYAGLIQASNGDFYGTTVDGGANRFGTIFRITPEGDESVVYSFRGGTADGSGPSASLLEGKNGNFYGTTYGGGAGTGGTVFKWTLAGKETVLASFVASGTGGGPAGAYPYAALIKGKDGNLYGTTEYGGADQAGTAFSVTPGGDESAIYSFGSSNVSFSGPNGLIQGRDGNLYGTTANGGAHGGGVLFKLNHVEASTTP
jgi:uncharacterized repeat protein (TIGR03803 family)